MQMKPTQRHPGRSLLLGLLPVLTILTPSEDAAAQAGRTRMYMGVKIKPIMTIRVGDKGYCKTVFHGLKVGTFRFHVKGILFNYFPRQHLILIASDDPKLKRSGIVAGMSGSPCYIHGGLAGALAYGPRWTKRPIAMLSMGLSVKVFLLANTSIAGINAWGIGLNSKVCVSVCHSRSANSSP